MQRTASLIALAFAILNSSTTLSAQLPSNGSENAPVAPQHKPITFDVASIRLEKNGGGGPIGFTNDGFTVDAAPLEYLIRFAYDVTRDNSVIGLPSWGATDYYVVLAKVAEADVPEWKSYNPTQRRLVLQQLLSDRFHLTLHPDTVERPIYSLVIAKGGPKLQSVTPPENDHRGFIESKDYGVQVGHHVTIPGLVDMLSRSYFGLDRQVYNKTALTGNYDFTLTYEPLRGRGSSTSESEPSGRPTIFSALQEQLGLKLEPATGPVKILIVEHVERPSDN
jgi:uncharacterized protein (TIGR03435 family)